MPLVAVLTQWFLTRPSMVSSFEIFSTLVAFVLALSLVRAVQNLQKIRQLPPGPWGIPFLGFLPYLSATPHEQFRELSQKYGKIFSARLGSQLIVVLTDYHSIRTAFRKEVFSGRPENEIASILEGYGIINVEGKLWKDQRRFLHNRLRHFGMKHAGNGKEQLETRIMVEVETFLQALARTKGEPGSLNQPLALSISNVICSMLMSVRFGQNDHRFKRFMKLIEEGFKLVTTTGATNFIPWLRHLPRMRELNNKIKANRSEMANFFKEIVDMHKTTVDKNNIRDIVDSYLVEIEKAKEEGREGFLFEGKDADRQIYQIIGDVYSAAMETTKTTLQWAIAYMLHHPDVMRGVQDELDQVVGRSRLPTSKDLPYLPYMEATLCEILRRSSVVPLGTTHSTKNDTMLNEFVIPKNTQVIPVLHAVHMDPTLWDEPEKFNPSRFLNSEGAVVKPEYFMPFGVGRRMCLGDVLAKLEIFLFFSSLLHVYNLELPKGDTLPNLKGNTGISTTPDDFKVCATPRPIDLNFKLDAFAESQSSTRFIGQH